MPPMNKRSFFVDENTSRSLVSSLHAANYQAEHVCDVGLQGHPDIDVFTYAQTHQQIIITADLDFSNITQYPPPHHGIIVLRLSDTIPVTEISAEVLNALSRLEEESFTNTLFIVEKGRVRIRR